MLTIEENTLRNGNLVLDVFFPPKPCVIEVEHCIDESTLNQDSLSDFSTSHYIFRSLMSTLYMYFQFCNNEQVKKAVSHWKWTRWDKGFVGPFQSRLIVQELLSAMMTLVFLRVNYIVNP